MRVWEALARKSPVVTIEPTESLADAIRYLVEGKIRALPVVDEGKLVGIVTTQDVLWTLDGRGAGALAETVDRVMTRDPVTADRDAPLTEVERVFVERGISHIPILEENKLVGVLTPADVLGSELGDVQWLNEHLHALVHGGVR